MQAYYYRPIIQSDASKPEAAVSLLGGNLWFDRVERLNRETSDILAAKDIPQDVLETLTTAHAPLCGIDMAHPSIMGILNATPDSFSDGGQYNELQDAVARAQTMIDQGADMIDIGGESTRPGADYIPTPEETRRTTPIIQALRDAGVQTPISIDTRKASVAQAALAAGADLFNDVTALTYDPHSLSTAADTNASVCIMHAAGDPKTMQHDPSYDNVLLDVYDYLSKRIEICVTAGIPRPKVLIDLGIGFGKTDAHNLLLLQNISLFHTLGCPVLLGVSRKSLIGRLADAPNAADRVAGSIALALDAVNQGVQMVRVHDVAETKQALTLWAALRKGQTG